MGIFCHLEACIDSQFRGMGEDRHDQDNIPHSWGILWQGQWSLRASSWKKRTLVRMVNHNLFTCNITQHLQNRSTIIIRNLLLGFLAFESGSFQKILDKGQIHIFQVGLLGFIPPLSGLGAGILLKFRSNHVEFTIPWASRYQKYSYVTGWFLFCR